MSIKPILFENGVLKMIDQRLLPTEEVWLEYSDYREVAEAIRTMVVRGAPAIGVAAAFGAAFGARNIVATSFEEFMAEFEQVCAVLAATRPTAVNLFWALERMKTCARAHAQSAGADLKARLLAEAVEIAEEDERLNRTMGKNGEPLIPDGGRVLTHCNAGALATSGYGTALGVIRAAVEAGKKVAVFADETRPWLQGSRLTAWELMQDGIPVTLICDNMAGHLMSKGRSTASSSAPTASPPTATPPTRSAPTRWRCWPRSTASPSTSPHRPPPSISLCPTAAISPSKSAPPAR
jgi:methylthioribose-1-phosphate isomerase